MKKLLLVSILFFVVLFCFSKEKEILIVDYAFEIGYLPLNNWILFDPTDSYFNYQYDKIFYMLFNFKAIFSELFFIGFGTRSNFCKLPTGFYFNSCETVFNFTFGFTINKLLEIGFRNFSNNPMIIYNKGKKDLLNRNLKGNYQEIYIQMNGIFTLF